METPEMISSQKKTVAVILMGGPTKGLFLIRIRTVLNVSDLDQKKIVTNVAVFSFFPYSLFPCGSSFELLAFCIKNTVL